MDTQQIEQILNEVWFLAPNSEWLELAVSILLCYCVYFLAGRVYMALISSPRIVSRIPAIVKSSMTPELKGPTALFWASLFGHFSLVGMKFPVKMLLILSAFMQFLFVIALVRILLVAIDNAKTFLTSTATTRPHIDSQLVSFLSKAFKIFIVALSILLFLQSLGFNVWGPLAALGLGGVALALAAQDTAKNLFGSLALTLDRPFMVGQRVKTKDVDGIVEDIGLRCTRIRTFENSVVSIPNGELAVANIENLDVRSLVRVRFEIGVTYDTPADKIEAFCEGIKQIIRAHSKTDKKVIRVYFHNFSASSLDIQVTYFVPASREDDLFAKHTIGLQIIRLAEAMNIEFAFPTQTLHLASTPERPFEAKRFDSAKLLETARNYGPQGSFAKFENSKIYSPKYQEDNN